MTRDDFLTFTPRFEDPLVISFIEFSRSHGLSSEIGFGFWDFLVYDGVDEPEIAVKTVKNRISDAVLRRIVSDPTPKKVILVEGGSPDLDRLVSQQIILGTTGTGVFVRGVGWRALPGGRTVDAVEDLQLKMAPRWAQDPDGIWRKTCTKCHERKPTGDFYRSAYRTAKDPYRNICKACWAVGEGRIS